MVFEGTPFTSQRETERDRERERERKENEGGFCDRNVLRFIPYVTRTVRNQFMSLP